MSRRALVPLNPKLHPVGSRLVVRRASSDLYEYLIEEWSPSKTCVRYTTNGHTTWEDISLFPGNQICVVELLAPAYVPPREYAEVDRTKLWATLFGLVPRRNEPDEWVVGWSEGDGSPTATGATPEEAMLRFELAMKSTSGSVEPRVKVGGKVKEETTP